MGVSVGSLNILANGIMQCVKQLSFLSFPAIHISGINVVRLGNLQKHMQAEK